MNTSHLEKVAENLIAHELMRNGFSLAKPMQDELGADLIAFAEFGDGVKFCRIQCKGRSLNNNTCSVIIPEKYVTSAFVIFLYVRLDLSAGQLFCFFSQDIRKWKRTPNGSYRLPITRSTLENRMKFYRFSDEKMSMLRDIILSANSTGVLRDAVYGEIRGVLPSMSGVEASDSGAEA